MNSFAAYIDESGNHDLATAKTGASRYFVVLAILIPQVDIEALETSVAAIRKKHFGNGEIKSSSVKGDRRLKILHDLAPFNFRFFAVAVDKARVERDSGLRFKRSFIKFANGKLYSALFQNLESVSIFADTHGSPEFTNSFVEYMEQNHKKDLFSTDTVQMVDSKSHVLVQLADFLVGTVAKFYEGKVTPAFRSAFLEFITSKKIRIDEWPIRSKLQGNAGNASTAEDEAVRTIALNAAAQFLEDESKGDDFEIRAQCATLSFMLFRATFEDNHDFISTVEVIEHLSSHGFTDINSHYVRSNLISKLRDNNVVIASSSRGYKIPTSYADVLGFVDLVDGIACPMLARLKRAEGIFDLGSAGKIKLLNSPRFSVLKRMLDNSEDSIFQ